jgi:hypothetical protein
VTLCHFRCWGPWRGRACWVKRDEFMMAISWGATGSPRTFPPCPA